MNKFRQPGEVMDYTNTTGADLASGDVVVIGTRIGVCETAIANGATGSARVQGVCTLAKKTTDTPAQGALLYWDATNKYLTTTTTSNTLAGYAFKAGANGDTAIDVKLNA